MPEMAELSLLAIVVIIIVLSIVIFKLVSGILKTVLIVGAIGSIVLAVAGAVVVKDALDLKSGLESSGAFVLFTSDDGSRLTSGILAGKGGNSTALNANAVSESGIISLNEQFSKGSFKAIQGDAYLVMAVRENFLFSSLPQVIEADGQSIDKDVALAQLSTATAEERAEALAGAFGLAVSHDSGFVAAAFKSGNLKVYPETPVFKALKILPASLLESVSGRLFSGLER